MKIADPNTPISSAEEDEELIDKIEESHEKSGTLLLDGVIQAADRKFKPKDAQSKIAMSKSGLDEKLKLQKDSILANSSNTRSDKPTFLRRNTPLRKKNETEQFMRQLQNLDDQLESHSTQRQDDVQGNKQYKIRQMRKNEEELIYIKRNPQKVFGRRSKFLKTHMMQNDMHDVNGGRAHSISKNIIYNKKVAKNHPYFNK